MDYGPRFASEGIVELAPPTVGDPYATLVPQVDGLGNEMGGIRTLETRVPLATYAPWRLRPGPEGEPVLADLSDLGGWLDAADVTRR